MSHSASLAWRCTECGCTRDEAARRRKRRGLGTLKKSWKTCSPECARTRIARIASEQWHRGRKAIPEPNHGAGWHCSECGADVDGANRRRRQLGLPPIRSITQKVCSPQCYGARWRRRRAARLHR